MTAPVLNSAVQFASTGPANAVTGAVNTIVNLAVDGPGHCANGQPDAVNCNLYAGKKFVWLVGDPTHQESGLADGTYFFAVLAPGGQSNPNDGGDGVLSDLDPSTGTGAGDAYLNRTFSITDGVIFYLGDADFVKHDFANNKIRLAPYDDTPNPGGEYIMAVCKLADATHPYAYPVTPSDCKYDAFKAQEGDLPAAHAPTVTKTAVGTNDRKYSWTITKAVDKTVVNTGNGIFNYTVIASRDTGMIGNVRVAGSITLSNPNNSSVAITSVTDVLSNGTTCLVNNAPTTLAPGNTTLTYSCELNSLPTQPLNNTATVSWAAQDVGGMPLAAGGVTASVTGIQFTEVPIDASANVTDSQVADGLGSTSATKTFTYAKTFTYDVLDQCKTFDNTATFTTGTTQTTGSASQSVKVCAGAKPLTATKTAAGTNARTYKWTIAKAADQTTIKTSTGSATFNYTVTATRDGGTVSNVHVTGTIMLNNPNADAVNLSGVTDKLSDGTDCTVINPPTSLPKGDTPVSYSCDLASLPASLDNTATVTWNAQAPGGHALDAGSATATVTGVQFTESKIDATVTVSDTYGNLGPTTFDPANPVTKFTYAKIFDNNPAGTCTSHDNTATFTTSDLHATGSASQSVKVCVGANLTASKTVAPSFTRSYAWGITKAVDKTVVKQVGGSATFAYTVNANQTGSTDSNWLVSGSITVNNPNNWEAVTVNLADSINNGGSCTVTGGSNVSVPAGGSVTANYTCSYGAAPAAAYTNTATATWNAGDAATPDGSANGTASGAFGAPTTIINGSVNVQDTFNGSATTLGTLTASDATPATGSWTYTHIIAVVANTCLTYNNTAAYTSNSGTTGSASRSVMVCGNVAGGLTKGFWQNKNGQAIITGGSATAGICNSATWLRQYAPFQDMNVAATCVQVASYAMNIIKAADASGAAMNAMLKAQMLATSLDVYFSDAALGGNKIAAPVALGGVKVDLTAICSTISLCSSTYANVSAAFGGATALTVSQILSYAAAQSNAGGSAWYGQVKAVQEMAKNTFDAINNAVALVSP